MEMKKNINFLKDMQDTIEKSYKVGKTECIYTYPEGAKPATHLLSEYLKEFLEKTGCKVKLITDSKPENDYFVILE